MNLVESMCSTGLLLSTFSQFLENASTEDMDHLRDILFTFNGSDRPFLEVAAREFQMELLDHMTKIKATDGKRAYGNLSEEVAVSMYAGRKVEHAQKLLEQAKADEEDAQDTIRKFLNSRKRIAKKAA